MLSLFTGAQLLSLCVISQIWCASLQNEADSVCESDWHIMTLCHRSWQANINNTNHQSDVQTTKNWKKHVYSNYYDIHKSFDSSITPFHCKFLCVCSFGTFDSIVWNEGSSLLLSGPPKYFYRTRQLIFICMYIVRTCRWANFEICLDLTV